MTRKQQITTTAHALVGLLAIRSWTAYELTQQMRRALRWAWPRTEANLYSEIKRLVPQGLARATEEESGGRVRTRYEVTEQGRAELSKWLSTAPAQIQVQFETLLRLFLADQGELKQLQDAVAATRSQIVAIAEEILPIIEDYAGEDPPYPGRAHLNVLFIAFMANFFRTVLEWCDVAEEEIGTWPGTADVGHTPGTRRMVEDALEFYRSVIDEKSEVTK